MYTAVEAKEKGHSFTQDCVCTLYHHINGPVLFFLIYSLVHRLDAKHGTKFVQGRMTQTNLSQKKNKSVVHFEWVVNMLCPSMRWYKIIRKRTIAWCTLQLKRKRKAMFLLWLLGELYTSSVLTHRTVQISKSMVQWVDVCNAPSNFTPGCCSLNIRELFCFFFNHFTPAGNWGAQLADLLVRPGQARHPLGVGCWLLTCWWLRMRSRWKFFLKFVVRWTSDSCCIFVFTQITVADISFWELSDELAITAASSCSHKSLLLTSASGSRSGASASRLDSVGVQIVWRKIIRKHTVTWCTLQLKWKRKAMFLLSSSLVWESSLQVFKKFWNLEVYKSWWSSLLHNDDVSPI